MLALQLSSRMEKPKVTHMKSWFLYSTRLIESLIADHADTESASVANATERIAEAQDLLRRELFGNNIHDDAKAEREMSSDSKFMHITLQVLPIVEIILRGEFASESIQSLEKSVRAFVHALKPLAARDHPFWTRFRNDAVGMFCHQLSLCLSSAVSLASKLSWSNDVVPHELEGYILEEDLVEVSNSERKLSTAR